jgi:2-oxoglutarate ferredoxin oxidoreductase subunit gamma
MACDRYGSEVRLGGLLALDADHVSRAPTTRAVRVPLSRIARRITGRDMGANVVGIGLVAALTEIVSRPALEAAIRARVPAGTVEKNLAALAAGYEAVEHLRAREEGGTYGEEE